jgi:hypothetical protein
MSDMRELLESLEALGRGPARENPRELLLEMGDKIVRAVAPQFGAQGDEVAILLLSLDGRHLRFVAPRRFSELGTIPLTKRDSIAVNILGRKQGEAINNVRMVKHVSFFESVKLRDRALPIQKMITVPILDGDTAVGVAQISRKGETPGEAGPDFTDADVRRAQGMFEEIASYLVNARPEKF